MEKLLKELERLRPGLRTIVSRGGVGYVMFPEKVKKPTPSHWPRLALGRLEHLAKRLGFETKHDPGKRHLELWSSGEKVATGFHTPPKIIRRWDEKSQRDIGVPDYHSTVIQSFQIHSAKEDHAEKLKRLFDLLNYARMGMDSVLERLGRGEKVPYYQDKK